jgi:60 kDa SS-A/Ro ribonucleoprotein
MANTSIFQSIRGKLVPAATTRNDAGGVAYELSPEAALARVAATGCITRTYYCSAEAQLDQVLALANRVSVDFLARTAIYSRQKGYMKDMPALLCAVLATRDRDRLIEVFPLVIDNGKMLRNFLQIIRSGVTGRKSLGTAPKRLVRQWLERATERQLLSAAIGQNPSLADVVKMVHPRPAGAAREAFYAWLIGKPHDPAALPETVRAYEAWKLTREGEVPDVPFQMLTALDLGETEWRTIAENAPWQMTRMNLNTFERHGVFKDEHMVQKIATRLADPEEVKRARVFPYQLLSAFLNTGKVPEKIREALQDAMESALGNVPRINGEIVIFVSDNESWADPKAHRGTAMMAEWEKLRLRNPKAKLVCIDIIPNTSAQAPDREDILNVAGFSDNVFKIIAKFARGGDSEAHWIQEIESQPLNENMKIA